jgi:hypothetical protein
LSLDGLASGNICQDHKATYRVLLLVYSFPHRSPFLLDPAFTLLRAYPETEQKATTSVEQDIDVFGSLHGGGNELRLDWSVCADAREYVATVRTVVAQVSAQSEGWAASCESAGRSQWHFLSVADGLSMEGVATAVRFAEHGTSILPGMEPTTRLPSILEEVSTNL